MELGNFSIERRFATGGMGEVWLGRHRGQNRHVAIKVMTGAIALNDDFQEQFRREVESTARLHHPNIVSVFDFGGLPPGADDLELVQNSPYFVMEFVEGGSLAAQLPSITWPTLRIVLEDVLAALAHAHARGVIHRDIKPDNILMGTYPGAGLRPVLTDFGIAYGMERNTTTYGTDITARSNEDMSGTPLYMAPEQFRGEFRDYGPWTDLYAIGVVAWEFATGAPPFVSRNPYHLGRMHMLQEPPEFKPRFDVPEGFERWVRRLLEKAPLSRYRTAADARWALKALDDPDDGKSESKLDLQSEVELNDMATMFMPVALPEGSTEVPPPPRDWRDADLRVNASHIDAGLGLFGLRTIPFIGRESERTALWQAFLNVNDLRKPRAVVVRGLAGTGKSRLAEWLFQTTQETGASVGYRATHQAEPGPMHGLPWMLTERFRCAGLRPKDTHARVVNLLGQYGDVDEHEARALADIMRVELTGDVSGRPSQLSLTNEQRLDVVRREMTRTAGDRIAVVWLDDVIWDRLSLAFVHHVLERATDPILFVLTVREEALAQDPSAREALSTVENHPRLSTINLEFFDDETFERLVRDGLMLTGPAAALVAKKCDGSPLYATQLVEFWLRRGALVARDGRIELVDATIEPPSGIASLWQSRLDHLVEELSNARALHTNQFTPVANPDTVWRRLEMAAALGRDIETDEWEHACEMAGLAPIPRLVDTLVDARLAERTPLGFSFVHGLLRDALTKHAQTQRRWKRLNLTCARMLTSRYAQEHPGLAFRVARHFVDAKNATFAQIALHEAFERESQAADPSRVVEVCRLMRNALELAETPVDHPMWIRIWTAEARARLSYSHMHEVERGEALVKQAVAAGRRRGPGIELTRALAAAAYAALLRDDLLEAQALSDEALLMADPATRLEVLCDAAAIHNALGAPDMARTCALEVLQKSERDDLIVQANIAQAEAARLQSRYAEALYVLDDTSGHPGSDSPWIFRTLTMLARGHVLDDDNQPMAALQAYEAAWAVLQEAKIAIALTAEERFARALLALHRSDEARVLLEELDRRLQVGERGVGVHPWDALLWAAAITRDWRTFESAMQRAFEFKTVRPTLRHFRSLAATCQILTDHRETRRRQRVAQHTLEVIERTGEGQTWRGLFEDFLTRPT